MSLLICVCLRWRMYLESAMWLMGSIMYQPNIIWPGILSFVLWYVDRTKKADASRIPIHGSASYIYVSCRLYVRTRFSSTWFIFSMIAFACGFRGEAVLVLILYSFSIRLFLNSLPRNSPPWSYVISTCYGYRTSHIVSNKFAIVIALLSMYCVTLNHSLTGYIIATDFKINGYFPFLNIL